MGPESIEAAAAAIYAISKHPGADPYEQLDGRARDHWRWLAREALEAAAKAES